MNEISRIDIKRTLHEISSPWNTKIMQLATISSVKIPMKKDHILYPVSAQVISIVVLSKSTRKRNTRYMLSIMLAALSTVTQSLEGKTALKNMLKTP